MYFILNQRLYEQENWEIDHVAYYAQTNRVVTIFIQSTTDGQSTKSGVRKNRYNDYHATLQQNKEDYFLHPGF